MRILLAGWSCSPLFQYGGLDTFMLNLAWEATRQGHSVTILGCHPDPGLLYTRARVDGVDAVVACRVTDLGRRNIYEIYARLSGIAGLVAGYDWVILNDYHVAPPLFYSAMAYGVRTTYYVHVFTGTPFDYAMIAEAGDVATNSKLMKDMIDGLLDVYRQIGIETQTREARVVYPAVPRLDLNVSREEVEAIRRTVTGGGEGYILHVHGRKQDNKNVELLEAIVEGLRNHGLEAYGLVTGRGHEPRRRGHVVYLGEVENPVVAYKAGDLFILPSTFEPFGLTALEAIASGTPAILSRNTGAYEFLSSYDDSIIPGFDPENPEEAVDLAYDLLTDKEYREEVYRVEHAVAFSRSWSDVLRELLG